MEGGTLQTYTRTPTNAESINIFSDIHEYTNNQYSEPHILNPTFAAPSPQLLLEKEKIPTCLPRGHIFGAICERESNFSFYFGGLLIIAFLVNVIYCLLNYQPDTNQEMIAWRYLFYIKAMYQFSEFVNYTIMRCFNVKCSNEIIHYSILSGIHLFYSWAFTLKKEEIKYAGYFAFAYVVVINIIGVNNINKIEATVSEIIFFAVTMKISADQNWSGTVSYQFDSSKDPTLTWYLTFFVFLLIALGALFILLILIFAKKKTLKGLITLLIFVFTSISIVLCVYFLDDFAEKGPSNTKYLLFVIPAPILSMLSFIILRGMIKDKYSDRGYQVVLRMYLLNEIDSVSGYIKRREKIRRREQRLVRERTSRMQNQRTQIDIGEQVLVKKKPGAIDRMAGLFMKGPSFFKKDSKNDSPRSSKDKNDSPEDKENKSEGKNDICIICYNPDNIPNTFYSPCSHAGVCKACALSMVKKNKSCPICRQKIVALIFYQKTPEGKFQETGSLEFKKKSDRSRTTQTSLEGNPT